MSPNDYFPNDLEACHALLAQQQEIFAKLLQQQTLVEATNQINEDLAREIEELKFENEQLKRFIYGRRSERHVEDPSQLKLFDKQNQEAVVQQEDPADELQLEEITYRRRKRSKTDRFPENLPREVQTIDVPPEERCCPCCSEEMPIIETDIRERLEYVPAKMIVHELHYPKRACGKCKQVVAIASPPESDQAGAALTAGSRYGFGVTAQTILGKYADHLPLYRLEDVFARAGVVIPRSTQVGLLDAAADLVKPLTDHLKAMLLSSNILGMDDTPVRLQDASLSGKMRTARFWLCRGRNEAPYTRGIQALARRATQWW